MKHGEYSGVLVRINAESRLLITRVCVFYYCIGCLCEDNSQRGSLQSLEGLYSLLRPTRPAHRLNVYISRTDESVLSKKIHVRTRERTNIRCTVRETVPRGLAEKKMADISPEGTIDLTRARSRLAFEVVFSSSVGRGEEEKEEGEGAFDGRRGE